MSVRQAASDSAETPCRDLCLLLRIPGKQRQVEDKGKPVPVDEEHESQESVDGSFGDDVGVEAVAKVDWVDVVTKRPGLAWVLRRITRMCAK